MYFIKDKLTVKVFLLVVLLLVCMVSLLVVFSRNFEEINTKYQQKVAELNSTFENLTGTQKQLNKTITDLELKNIKEGTIFWSLLFIDSIFRFVTEFYKDLPADYGFVYLGLNLAQWASLVIIMVSIKPLYDRFKLLK